MAGYSITKGLNEPSYKTGLGFSLTESTPKNYLRNLGVSEGVNSDFLGTNPMGGAQDAFNPEVYSLAGGSPGADTPWYQNNSLLSSYAGLGSALANLAALPSQIDFANAQTDSLKHNLSTAKEEQARRNKNISSFNTAGARYTA